MPKKKKSALRRRAPHKPQPKSRSRSSARHTTSEHAAPPEARPFPAPIDSLAYPRFAAPPTFMRLPHIPRPEELDVALVGIPFDGGATYRPGPRFGPRNIRVQSAIIRPYNPALKINPFERKRVADFGDLAVNPLSIEDTFERIERGLAPLVKAGVIPLSVGGDHSILLPILRALARRHGPLALVQLDAHSDTWDSYFGSRHSHGTPVRRAIEEGILVPNAVVQIGLRGQVYGESDFDFSRNHGIAWISSEEFHRDGVPRIKPLLRRVIDRPCYLTFDIDVVDPAFAPGTGTPQVGGLSSAQAVELVRALRGLKLVGADVVEVSPPYDTGEITSLLAANILYEILCLVA